MATGFLSLSRELRNEVYYHIFRQPEEDDFDYWDQPFHVQPQIILDSSLSPEEAFARAKHLHLRSRQCYHDRGLCTHKAFLRCCRQVYYETWPLFARHHRFVLTQVDDLATCLTSNLLSRARMDIIQHVALIDLQNLAERTSSEALSATEKYGKTLEQLWSTELEWFSNLLSLTIDLRLPDPSAPICPETYVPPILQPLINCTARTFSAYNSHPSTRKSRFNLVTRLSTDTLQLNQNAQLKYIRSTIILTRIPIHPAPYPDDFDLAACCTWTSQLDVQYSRTIGILGINSALASWPVADCEDIDLRTWSQSLNNFDLVVHPTDNPQDPPVSKGNLRFAELQPPPDEWTRNQDRRVAGRKVWFRHEPYQPPRWLAAQEDLHASEQCAWQSLELPEGIHCRIADDGFRCVDAADPERAMWSAPLLEFSAGEINRSAVYDDDDYEDEDV